MPKAKKDKSKAKSSSGGLFSCAHCDSDFLGKDDLDLHVELAHDSNDIPATRTEAPTPGSGPKPTTKGTAPSRPQSDTQTQRCNLCGKNVQDIEEHIKSAHKLKRNFICTLCNMSFKNQIGKNLHMKTCKGSSTTEGETPGGMTKASSTPQSNFGGGTPQLPKHAKSLSSPLNRPSTNAQSGFTGAPQAVATPVTPNGQNISSSGEPNANQVEEEEEEEDGALVVGVRKSNVVLQPMDIKPNLKELAASQAAAMAAKATSKQLKRASGLANDPETNTAKKRKVKGGKENVNQGMESAQNLAAKSPSLASTMGKNPLQPIAPKPSSGTAAESVTASSGSSGTPCMLCEKSVLIPLRDHLKSVHKVSQPKMAALIKWGGGDTGQNERAVTHPTNGNSSLEKPSDQRGSDGCSRVSKYPCYECDFMGDNRQACLDHFRDVHGLRLPDQPQQTNIEKPQSVKEATKAKPKRRSLGQLQAKAKAALDIHNKKSQSQPPADMPGTARRVSLPTASAQAVVAQSLSTNNNAKQVVPPVVKNISAPPLPAKAHQPPPPRPPSSGPTPKPAEKEKLLTCKKCGFKCGDKQKLLQHFTKEHMIKVNKKKSPTDAPTETSSKTGPSKSPETKCDLCTFKTSGGQEAINLHLQKFHGVQAAAVAAKALGPAASQQPSVATGPSSSGPAAVHPCPKCPFNANTAEAVKGHLLKAHSSSNQKCQLCDFVCSSVAEVSRHMVVTHGVPESMTPGGIGSAGSTPSNGGSEMTLKISSVVGGL